MSDWTNNIPPGVSMRDLYPKVVECGFCDGNGEIESGGDDELCYQCPRCGGTGEVPKGSQ